MFKKFLLPGLVLVGLAAVFLYFFTPFFSSSPTASTPESVQSRASTSASTEHASSVTPLAEPIPLRIQYHASGRIQLTIHAENNNATAQDFTLPAGSLFAFHDSMIMTTRSETWIIPPHKIENFSTPVVALHAYNSLDPARYTPVSTRPEKLAPVYKQLLTSHPSPAHAVLQTAVLLLLDNPHLATFAQFPTPEDDLPLAVDPDAYKVPTQTILEALLFLRKCEIDLSDIQVASNEQLALEGMLDKNCHPLAIDFLNLSTPEQIWDFWHHALVDGASHLRTYALYGIARYYPDVALKMLPDWIHNENLSPTLRLAAIYALTYTQHPQALEILESLQPHFSKDSNYQQAVRASIAALEKQP